ncbi:MAG TPA: thiol:disulfide interchange protein [Gallionella sp.]|jgi:thiol:disulfide interchange protein DsbC|nr:DsbC family protein [Gallionella sp.]OGS66785.1 MAG: thiol:disulfide interchange protein [Gallionellales bacterium GWA2_54_124]OGT17846.1 MAG: thiol:disulfide interchange protein [Gallionellales bacterium RIFOXYD12_FULL_53_10]HCI53860.1 thiol:disulfide interchange protein [Gallionella sp.]
MNKILSLLLLLATFPAHAGEAEIRQSLQGKVGKLEHIVKTPYAGLYEIMVGDKVLYTDELGLYLIDGSIFDVKNRTDLTEQRRRQLFNFDKLPLELAIKKIKGNGKRKLAYFTDPQCGYCKKLEKELSKVSDVTLYMFLYPIFPGSEEIVRNVRCSKDPAKTWDDLMLKGVAAASITCKTPTDKVTAFGREKQVNGTPNLIFADGTQVPGYLPAEELEKHLNEAAKK